MKIRSWRPLVIYLRMSVVIETSPLPNLDNFEVRNSYIVRLLSGPNNIRKTETELWLT